MENQKPKQRTKNQIGEPKRRSKNQIGEPNTVHAMKCTVVRTEMYNRTCYNLYISVQLMLCQQRNIIVFSGITCILLYCLFYTDLFMYCSVFFPLTFLFTDKNSDSEQTLSSKLRNTRILVWEVCVYLCHHHDASSHTHTHTHTHTLTCTK